VLIFFIIVALAASILKTPSVSRAIINSDFFGASAPGKMTALEISSVWPCGLMQTSIVAFNLNRLRPDEKIASQLVETGDFHLLGQIGITRRLWLESVVTTSPRRRKQSRLSPA